MLCVVDTRPLSGLWFIPGSDVKMTIWVYSAVRKGTRSRNVIPLQCLCLQLHLEPLSCSSFIALFLFLLFASTRHSPYLTYIRFFAFAHPSLRLQTYLCFWDRQAPVITIPPTPISAAQLGCFCRRFGAKTLLLKLTRDKHANEPAGFSLSSVLLHNI